MNMDAAQSQYGPATEAPSPAPSPTVSPRILIVDDVEDNREILARRLVRRGYEILEARNGTEALEMIERENLDLVLLDIMMPDIMGTEVVRRVRQTRSPSELPIIMVSAKTLSEDVAESLELGANDYVIKPVDFTVALARIRTQIENRQAACKLADAAEAERREREAASKCFADESRKHEATSEKLNFLAYHDELTGLANRVAFREALDNNLAATEQTPGKLLLFFIDLDRFKAVNDVYGHQVGDELLRNVGARLREALPASAKIARLGGDEFAALCRMDEHGDDGSEIAAHIVDELCRPFTGGNEIDILQIGASVGIADAHLCEWRADTLMKAADLAMYRAKSSGRGQYFVYEPCLLEEHNDRSALEVDLRRALSLGQFEVYYQPLIDAVTREISSFEALVRWNHPTRGTVSPDQFISTAEDTGLIVPLGGWVMRQACKDAASWPEGIGVAVNISPEQFRSPELLRLIKSALSEANLASERLEVEITESCLLETGEDNGKVFDEIRALGVRIVIDDFGTGYSSMSYLQNFSFDKLKIDRRFIEGLDLNPKSAAIVGAIIQMSDNIGATTTAEGIETESQMSAMLSRGCTQFQGYFFSPPMPILKTIPYLRDYIGKENPEE